MMTCKHCHHPNLPTRARGLCHRCHDVKEIRDQYPSGNKSGQDEPTQEELDQMISEQMSCLPKWWHGESIRQKDNHWLSSRVVRLGRDIVNNQRRR
jgi:hypothetical protein